MNVASESLTPGPEDWEWLKALMAETETTNGNVLPPGERVSLILAEAKNSRPGMVPFVERYVSAMLDDSSTHLLSTGDQVASRYTITRFLGSGGMGEVYAVADSELEGETVALKVLRFDGVRNPNTIWRFEQEIRAAASVSHSNVCQIHDVGRHQSGDTELPFLTMDLLAGTPLSNHIASTSAMPASAAGKSEAEALKIIRQLAAGLAALHAKEIVHRDLKPTNVFLVPELNGSSRVVIMDFGLARTLTSTGSHTPIGTSAYMAPEQITAVAPSAFSSDVYSLGVTSYEILTGRRYKRYESAKTLKEAGVSSWLRDVVTRCLEPEVTKRFQNASEVVDALDNHARNYGLPSWVRPIWKGFWSLFSDDHLPVPSFVVSENEIASFRDPYTEYLGGKDLEKTPFLACLLDKTTYCSQQLKTLDEGHLR